MHEFGHNIGLFHPNDEVSCGPGTCLMGSSPAKFNSPCSCFNSAESWQLGWNDHTTLILSAEEITDNLHQLVSIAECNIITLMDDYVIIKITKCTEKNLIIY